MRFYPSRRGFLSFSSPLDESNLFRLAARFSKDMANRMFCFKYLTEGGLDQYDFLRGLKHWFLSLPLLNYGIRESLRFRYPFIRLTLENWKILVSIELSIFVHVSFLLLVQLASLELHCHVAQVEDEIARF